MTVLPAGHWSQVVESSVTSVRNALRLLRWHGRGCPAPPPHVVKQRNIARYAREYGVRTLVETGTFRGDMVAAMLGRFNQIITIELSPEFHRAACQRFAAQPHVELVLGDSGEQLTNVVDRLREPALFWLDGHYSGGDTARGSEDTPIFRELATIFASPVKRHVILIDDARCFGTDPGYPMLEALRTFVAKQVPTAGFAVADDSIRITPAK